MTIRKTLSTFWTAPGVGNRLRRSMLLAIMAGPAIFGLVIAPQMGAQAPQTTAMPTPSFEVASIKPNRVVDMKIGIMQRPGRITMNGVTTKLLIAHAYNVKDFQISGGPSWIKSDRYDIDAKEEDSMAAELEKLPPEQRAEQIRLMLQSLLADRFKLSLTHTTRELPVYALVIAKTGPKLQEAKPGDTYPSGMKGPDGRAGGVVRGSSGGQGLMMMNGWRLIGQAVPIANLANALSQQLGRNVVDQTGLKGKYDFTLQWTPDQSQKGMLGGPEVGAPGPDSPPTPDANGPSIFTAIQEQLGLKLESTKGPVDFLVIDHIEKPSEN